VVGCFGRIIGKRIYRNKIGKELEITVVLSDTKFIFHDLDFGCKKRVAMRSPLPSNKINNILRKYRKAERGPL
jgi:hypothetical protein